MSSHKIKGTNIAALLQAAFSYNIFQRAIAIVFYNNVQHTFQRGHSQEWLCRGYSHQNPAGPKLAHMAVAGTLTKKGSEYNE